MSFMISGLKNKFRDWNSVSQAKKSLSNFPADVSLEFNLENFQYISFYLITPKYAQVSWKSLLIGQVFDSLS